MRVGFFVAHLRTLDALHLAIASGEALELLTSDKSLFGAVIILDVDAHLIGC